MLHEAPLSAAFLQLVQPEEIDVNHGIVEVFAYQETLLIMAVFGIALLAMIWVGFRRWLQYKEKMGRLIADQTAELTSQYGAHIESVDARLKAIEATLTDGGAHPTAPIEALQTNALPDPKSNLEELRLNPESPPEISRSGN